MGLTYFEDIKKLKAYLVQDVQSGYKGIYRMYLGNERIYPNAGTVTYHVDTNVTYTEEVDIDESILNPSTFTPSKSGWTFVGWRKDTTASGSVLSDEVMTGDDVVLYAVFQQIITLSYNGNGNTSGSTANQTGYRYYNNGSIENPSFILSNNGFSKTDYTFTKWAIGSAGGTQYDPGASIILSTNTTFYAIWRYDYLGLSDHFAIGMNGHQGDISNGSGRYINMLSVRDYSTYASMEAAPETTYNGGILITKPITTLTVKYLLGSRIPGTSKNEIDIIVYIRKNGSNVLIKPTHVTSTATARDESEGTVTLRNLQVGDIINMYIQNNGPYSLRVDPSYSHLVADGVI